MFHNDKTLKSRSHLVDYVVPSHHLMDYYKKIEQNGPIYAILSITGDESQLFFSPHNGSKSEFVAHVFFRQKDAALYLKALKSLKSVSADSIIAWETTATSLAASIKKVVDKEKRNRSNKSFSAISCIYLQDEFREIELFWTGNRDSIN